MKGRDIFNKDEIKIIRDLLKQKCQASPSKQEQLRRQLRSIEFYISDFSTTSKPFCVEDLNFLIRNGVIRTHNNMASSTHKNRVRKDKSKASRRKSDELYILDLCDSVLGQKGERQYTFPFLKGDSGTLLRVDAYYKDISLVIEYHERQHKESVPIFDEPLTVSGCDRGEQRTKYDQRRREILPANGINLVELSFDEFQSKSDKRLCRKRESDIEVIRERLSKWIGSY